MTYSNPIESNICALNIQGLKKFVGNAEFLKFCRLYDIIALTETWQETEREFQKNLQGFSCFECIRKKKRTAARGSGGVALFIKDKLLQYGGVTRIYEHFTECVVLRFSAETFQRQNDLVMFFTYVAPENSPVYTTEDNGIVLLGDKLSEIVLDNPNAEIFLAGDLNSRISNFQDFIPYDDLQFVFGETDYPSDTFDMPRVSKDNTCNRFGTYFIDLCCTYGIHVFNGCQ